MNRLTNQRLAELAIEAMERTAFVLAEPAEQGGELPPPDRFGRIMYSGASMGQVFLAASEGLVRELAAGVLGVEPDEIDVDVEGRDALRELTNIVAGSVILCLGGADRRLSLGLPECIAALELPPGGGSVERCCIDAEGERLEVIWAPEARCDKAA